MKKYLVMLLLTAGLIGCYDQTSEPQTRTLSPTQTPRFSEAQAPAKRAEPTGQDRWVFYKDARGEWRWRHVAANNRIEGSSSEGYANKQDCWQNAIANGMPE
jgi:uncharacterized protein YegP (UPF0339 family)